MAQQRWNHESDLHKSQTQIQGRQRHKLTNRRAENKSGEKIHLLLLYRYVSAGEEQGMAQAAVGILLYCPIIFSASSVVST
jgi:hypothetical protein